MVLVDDDKAVDDDIYIYVQIGEFLCCIVIVDY